MPEYILNRIHRLLFKGARLNTHTQKKIVSHINDLKSLNHKRLEKMAMTTDHA